MLRSIWFLHWERWCSGFKRPWYALREQTTIWCTGYPSSKSRCFQYYPWLPCSTLRLSSCVGGCIATASLGQQVICRLPVPVVSVGNITWGGNGKTPMVDFLSGCFLNGGICPLILTRGYAGGDEAHLLQRHLEGSCAKVGIGSNRAAIARSILAEHGIMDMSKREQLAECIEPCSNEKKLKHRPRGDEKVGVVLLDDGMQHWQLTRDLEIVMVNLITTWGNNHIVPRGPLRESLEELRRADIIVLHHADLVSNQKIENVRHFLGQVMRSGCLVVLSRMAPRYLLRPLRPGMETRYSHPMHDKSGPLVSLDLIKGSVVLCVSGVGCPEAVSLVLQQMGCFHVERLDYLDHHNFQAEELDHISVKYFELHQKFPGGKVLLVLTEKDYVRDPAIWASLRDVEVLVLHSSLEILPAEGGLKALKKMLTTVVRKQAQNESQADNAF